MCRSRGEMRSAVPCAELLLVAWGGSGQWHCAAWVLFSDSRRKTRCGAVGSQAGRTLGIPLPSPWQLSLRCPRAERKHPAPVCWVFFMVPVALCLFTSFPIAWEGCFFRFWFGFFILSRILAVSLPRPPASGIVPPAGAAPRSDASRHASCHAAPTNAARRGCPRPPLRGCAHRGTPASPAPLPSGRDAPSR